MTDLAVRLQATLDEREEFARDAMQRRWLTTDNYIEDENGGEVARFNLKRDAQHAGLNEPQAVLRLVQAHRDILAMYVEAKAQPVRREGREARLRGLDHASAMGRLTTLGLVVQALARGYGLEAT